MSNLEKSKKLNIFKVLKRILVDEENGINEIPGLDNIQPTSQEEAELIEELKRSQKNIDNKFRDVLKVKPSKLKKSAKESKGLKINQKVIKNEEKERID